MSDFTVARRRFATERHTYGRAFTARYAGWCPLCGKYIVKSRSKVVSVNPPITPACAFEDDSANGYRHHTNYTRAIFSDQYEHGPSLRAFVDGLPRKYVHQKCAVKRGGQVVSNIEIEIETDEADPSVIDPALAERWLSQQEAD